MSSKKKPKVQSKLMASMFNQGDHTGFDLINHAIRMGTMGTVNEVLRKGNDILLQLNNANTALLGKAGPPGGQPPSSSAQNAMTTTSQQQQAVLTSLGKFSADKISSNAFQFPWKLHDMLDNARADGVEDIVSWSRNGRSFRVHKPPKFVDIVMGSYFKQTKYKSFQRQLNLYGFIRINEGPMKGGYKHKFFVRGQRALCQLISRSSASEALPERYDAHTDQGQIPVHNSKKMHVQVREPSLLGRERDLTQDTRDSIYQSVTGTSRASSATENFNASDGIVTQEKPKDYRLLVQKEFQFPWKVHEMLDRSVLDGFEQIVSWQPPDESCFKVHDTDGFVRNVMPLFFKQTKYKSFQRQLNLYGFTRVDEGPNKGSYFHKLFVKGRKDLLKGLIRQKIKSDKPVHLSQSGSAYEGVPRGLHLSPRTGRSVSIDSGIPAILAAVELSERPASDQEKNDESDSAEYDPSSNTEVPVSADGLSWRQNPSESFSDWTIEVVQTETQEKERFHVHRRVLAVGPKRSEYFARIFKKKNTSNKSVLNLGKLEYSVFPMMLDYMYAGVNLHLNTTRAYALYSLAENVEVSSILQSVTEFYEKIMTKDNIIHFITLGRGFCDKTLLEAAIGKCAEELRSIDQTVSAKLEPAILLRILQKLKTLPRNYKCSSSHLSELVAECVRSNIYSLTHESLRLLTEKDLLPHIEAVAAVKILAAENKLCRRGDVPKFENTSLHERCVSSITTQWKELRKIIADDPLLSGEVKAISSAVLCEILMRTTMPSES